MNAPPFLATGGGAGLSGRFRRLPRGIPAAERLGQQRLLLQLVPAGRAGRRAGRGRTA